mmetsp:Transcript_12572/g.24178  ORF Transcript_12572/g.24178 Transcript_12572/m.24178 type:complete len:124 (-) Transcript_12572:52-423(-)
MDRLFGSDSMKPVCRPETGAEKKCSVCKQQKPVQQFFQFSTRSSFSFGSSPKKPKQIRSARLSVLGFRSCVTCRTRKLHRVARCPVCGVGTPRLRRFPLCTCRLIAQDFSQEEWMALSDRNVL